VVWTKLCNTDTTLARNYLAKIEGKSFDWLHAAPFNLLINSLGDKKI